MSRSPTLTLAYLNRYPDSAAQVLDGLDAGCAGAFLETVPTRLAAAVVDRMSSWSAARTLLAMSPPKAAAILRQMPLYDGVGLLRLIPAAQHAVLLDELPSRRAQRLRNALKYPAGSVGAWIDPDIPAFSVNASAAEAMRYLRHSEDDSHVFLHAADSGRLVGALPVGRLLRSDPDTAIGDLPWEPVVPLSSRASLASAASHPDWDRFLVLPVAGRAGTMVGGLSRASLGRGLADRAGAGSRQSGSMTVQLLTMLGVVCSGLIKAVTAGRPAAENGEHADG